MPTDPMPAGRTVAAAMAATLLLHFAWEMAQMWFFTDMRDMTLLQSSARCFRATLGDLLIAATAYLVASLVARTVRWPARGSAVPVVLWFATGLAITIVFERLAIAAKRWTYAPEMPTVAGVGLLPVLQWLVVPALLLVIIRAVMRKALADA